MMKSLCASLVIVLTLASVSSSRAQGSGMFMENWKDLLVGPMVTGGVGINAGAVDTGFKTGIRPAFSVGAMFIYPWSPDMALTVGLCYDARGVNFHSPTSTDTGFNVSLGYIALRPEFRIMGFMIGLGLGLPVSGSATEIETGTSSTITTSDLGFLLEGRIGADIPVWKSDASQLHLMIEGSYGFTKVYSSSFVPSDTKDNGPLATAEIGLAYFFDLTPH